MGLFKSFIKGKVTETKEKVASAIPDWSQTKFDKVVNPMTYNDRRRFIDQKFRDLVVIPDEAPEKDGSSSEKASKVKDQTESKAKDSSANTAETEEEAEKNFSFDPSDNRQVLLDTDSGEVVASAINQSSPQQIAEQAVNIHKNKQFVDVASESIPSHEKTDYHEQEAKEANMIDQVPKRAVKAGAPITKVKHYREEYRQRLEAKKKNQVRDENFSSNSVTDSSAQHVENTVSSAGQDENQRSLDSMIPPEEPSEVEPPIDEAELSDLPKRRSRCSRVSNSPEVHQDDQSSNSPEDSNDYKPMSPSDEDKKVIEEYKKILAQRISNHRQK